MNQEPNSGWLHGRNVSLRYIAGTILLWFGVFYFFDKSQLGHDLENKVALSVNFRVREALGRSPTLHPNIKVYGVDDSTVSRLKRPGLNFLEWAKLILSIAENKPKAIVIDALFSIPEIPEGREAEAKELIKRLEVLATPVVVGGFTAPQKLPHRDTISTDRDAFQLPRRIKYGKLTKAQQVRKAAELNLPVARSVYLYGPNAMLLDAFRYIGHIIYLGDGRAAPYLRINDTTAIPHFMMLTDGGHKFSKKGLTSYDALVPQDREGYTILNFNTFVAYLKITKPLYGLLEAANKGSVAKGIKAGDVVYIMPYLYTGNTDFKMTPFGNMPAGYAHLAFLNSMMTGNWLKPVTVRESIFIGMILAGLALGVAFGPIGFGASIVVGLSLWIGLVLYLFSFRDLVIPWILPTLSFLASAVTIFVEKARVAEKKSQFIHNAFDGMVAPQEIAAMAKNPELLNFEARERVVTVMFIDIVGFSLMAENQLPRIAFDHLKDVLADISDVVHKHGGIVNKNLGDGLLCFFGYSLEKDESTLDHAEKAVACGIEIQRENMPKIILAAERGEPVYPLRIGINTSSVFLGNIGSERRIDLTVVGNGVNFAKRLESGCETHSVMMSETTKELIDTQGMLKDGLRKKYIEIKHHSEMVVAYEYDPFFNEPDLRSQAVQAHRSSAHLARVEKRWDIARPDDMLVTTNIGTGSVINFSQTGLRITLPTLIVKGAILQMTLDSADGKLKPMLEENGIGTIDVDVRWGYGEGDKYIHGVRFRQMPPERKKRILGCLKKYAVASENSEFPDDELHSDMGAA